MTDFLYPFLLREGVDWELIRLRRVYYFVGYKQALADAIKLGERVEEHDMRLFGQPRMINNLLRVWNLVRGVTGDELRRMQNADVSLAVVGSSENRAWMLDKLDASIDSLIEYPTARQAKEAGVRLVLNADDLSLRSPDGFTQALTALAQSNPDKRIALGAKYPVFRPVVTGLLTREYATKNAKMAAISALPGIVPVLDWMLPATAAGDMLTLTRNQMTLLLEIAACYNLPPDPRERLTELLPVVGGAFGWRAIAREALGIVPGGIGVAVKAGVAYAGTFAVGRAASYYYASGGRKLDMTNVYRTAFKEAVTRGKALVERRGEIVAK